MRTDAADADTPRPTAFTNAVSTSTDRSTPRPPITRLFDAGTGATERHAPNTPVPPTRTR